MVVGAGTLFLRLVRVVDAHRKLRQEFDSHIEKAEPMMADYNGLNARVEALDERETEHFTRVERRLDAQDRMLKSIDHNTNKLVNKLLKD